MASEQNDPARPGNEFFVQKEYEKALEAYSTAIEKYPDMAKLYSNRAMSYLKLERPFYALKDVDSGLKFDADNDKLIYRKCKALLALRRFSDAGQFLDESIAHLDHLTKNKDFKALIIDMNRLKVEYERGQYDLAAMTVESKKSKFLDNHADYIAWNKIEIREIDGKGRALIAKEKIDAGELLIACKAFVFVDIESEVGQSMDLEKTRKKLTDRPDLAEDFYRLYAGPQLGHLENWTKEKSKLIDEVRIERIIQLNCFGADNILGTAHIAGKGLWLTPSYINHTCVDTNCMKDEEILLYYVPPYEERHLRCKYSYGFDCQCRLCVMDRRDSIEVKRRLEEIRKFMDDLDERMNHFGYNPSGGDIRMLGKFLPELRQLRPQRDLNFLALRVHFDLADLTYPVNRNESVRLMAEYFKVLKSIGSFERALGISKMMYKDDASLPVGKEEQEKWKEEARGIAKLIYGDERVADLIFKEG